MTGIGIDLAAATCRVMLRESTNKGTKFHHVTDGIRKSIPLFAAPSGAWGSRAAESGECRPADDPSGRLVFWKGLHQRLREHLGGLRPDPRDGNRTTLSVEVDEYAAELSNLLVRAGFDRFFLIGPADAALAACLDKVARPRNNIIVAMVVGEVTIDLRAVRLGDRGSVAACGQRVTVRDVGHACWRNHVRGMLEVRQRTELTSRTGQLAVDDSIVEFGRNLSRRCQATWHGARSDLFEPLVVRRKDTDDWPQVRALRHILPDSIREAVRELGDSPQVVIAIGGIGAVWPFVKDALGNAQLADLDGVDPIDLSARGAAVWQELEPFEPSAGAKPTLIAPPRPRIEASDAPAAGPPWNLRPDPFAVDEAIDDA